MEKRGGVDMWYLISCVYWMGFFLACMNGKTASDNIFLDSAVDIVLCAGAAVIWPITLTVVFVIKYQGKKRSF